ncbi:hypothetical protein ES703_43204 [subsurface metagenome]
MADRGINLSPIKWLGLVITIIALTNMAILLNVPVLRQIFSFIFLAFIPGFLLLSVLKLNKLGLVEKIVLSVGLSVAFSMLFGLVVNGSLLAIGYTKPLSTISLLISFSTATIVLASIAYIRNRDTTFSFSNFKLTTREKKFLIVPALFPLVSIIGMRIMNLTDNNVILMLLLFMIPAYVIFISFSNRGVSEKVYPTAIFLISISLLLMYSLRSNHIIGSDTHREYFIFLTTLDNLHWSKLGFGPLDACLSISILPAISQTFLNISQEYLFKLLCSLIVSILPLVVYLLSKKYIGSFYAFLASVFFMSQIMFLWTPSEVRSNIAVLFFALAIMVMFHDGISEFGKKALFIIFAASTIVSHYSTTYIVFFVLLLTWVGMQILSSIASRQKELASLPAENPVIEGTLPNFSSQGGSSRGSGAMAYKATTLELIQTQLGRGITITIIALFLAMLFLWYSEMTDPTFSAGVRFVYHSFAKWQWFLAKDIGGQPVVQAAIGRTLPYTGVPQRIEFVFSWLTIILLIFGLLTTARRFKTMVSTPDAGHKKLNFSLKKFEAEYLMLSTICFILLVATVALPYVSRYYGAVRTYFQMMVPLSIFFVIGGIELAKYLKLRRYWVVLVVLIPYFLCTTGAMCQISGFPRAITLNSEGPLYDMYISDAESYSAKWVREYAEQGEKIYATYYAEDVLLSQGKIPGYGIPGSRICGLREDKEIDGYIYLRHLDIDEGLVTKYPIAFSEKSKIYANARSQVYR